MKVFLGGTCAGWKWRDELQPLLKCDYYNPIVKNWSEEDRLREVHERETSQMAHSLKAVENMLKANGVIVFSGEKALLEVADYLNKAVSI